MLQIFTATFLPNIINTGQNLTKLLQKLKRATFYLEAVHKYYCMIFLQIPLLSSVSYETKQYLFSQDDASLLLSHYNIPNTFK